jgi:hypothetical protein
MMSAIVGTAEIPLVPINIDQDPNLDARTSIYVNGFPTDFHEIFPGANLLPHVRLVNSTTSGHGEAILKGCDFMVVKANLIMAYYNGTYILGAYTRSGIYELRCGPRGQLSILQESTIDCHIVVNFLTDRFEWFLNGKPNPMLDPILDAYKLYAPDILGRLNISGYGPDTDGEMCPMEARPQGRTSKRIGSRDDDGRALRLTDEEIAYALSITDDHTELLDAIRDDIEYFAREGDRYSALEAAQLLHDLNDAITANRST